MPGIRTIILGVLNSTHLIQNQSILQFHNPSYRSRFVGDVRSYNAPCDPTRTLPRRLVYLQFGAEPQPGSHLFLPTFINLNEMLFTDYYKKANLSIQTDPTIIDPGRIK